jgi:Protein of unknown function (DUF1769)
MKLYYSSSAQKLHECSEWSGQLLLLLAMYSLQGRFKRSVKASALCMGQEFVKPGNAPPWLGELVFTAAAKVFSSSTQVCTISGKY